MSFEHTRRAREHRSFDPLVHAKTTLDNKHRMAHEGFMFHASGKQVDLANAASAVFLMATPADCYPHIQRVELNIEAGDVDMVMRENVVTSDDGGAVPVLDVNRNTANSPCAVVTGSPTITTPGDVFHTIWVPPTGTGIGTQEGVLDVNQGEEWILAPSTKYSFTITNNSGGIIDYSYEFVWYEAAYDDLPLP